MKKIIYLGYYDTRKNPRNCSPAAVAMMNYVASAIRRNGYNLEIISPAQSEEELPEIVEIIENGKVVFLPSHGIKGKIIKRIYNKLRREKELSFVLEQHIGNNDVVIAYHSLAFIRVLKRLRKRKKFKFILQVNEIYADILEKVSVRKREIQWINEADAYLFSTKKLMKVLRTLNKKYAICSGNYYVEPIRSVCVQEKETKGKINVIYAGTFDFRKGGGIAVEAAKYLTSNYHVYICGYGNDKYTSLIIRKIEETAKLCACEISFEGCLRGEDYIQLLQKCQIGLCTQNLDSTFNASSFPSKISSYMSNGLQVVSVRIPAIEDSILGAYMYYYDTSSPKEVADTIMKIDLENCWDTRNIMENLDKEFCDNIKTVLEN